MREQQETAARQPTGMRKDYRISSKRAVIEAIGMWADSIRRILRLNEYYRMAVI